MARSKSKTQFTDHTLCEALVESIDEDAGVIRGVRILGRTSARGRVYSDQALRDAVRLYEGVRVNFDHPDERHLGAVRGFFDQIGCLKNCRLAGDGEGVVGDLEYLKAHPGAPMLLESAKRFPKLLGLSHNADGDRSRGADGKVIVESLREVRGVDIVTRPATTGGLFESEGDPDEDSEIIMADAKPKTKKTTLRKLIESAPAGTTFRDRAARLIEADAPMGDMAVEMPAEPTATEKSPEEAIRDSMTDAAISIVRKMFSGEMTPKDGIAKLQELLGMADQAAPAAEGKETPESVDGKLTELQKRTALIECENLLLRSDREAKQPWIEALAAVPVATRTALLESFPKKAAAPAKPAGGVQRPTTSPPLVESAGEGEPEAPAKDAKDFLARVRRG